MRTRSGTRSPRNAARRHFYQRELPVAAVGIRFNSSAANVLRQIAQPMLAQIVERTGLLPNGTWCRLDNQDQPAVSVRIIDGWCDVAIEWDDVQMMTENAIIVVTVISTTLPDTIADGIGQRRFAQLAQIKRLQPLDELPIEHVIAGPSTMIVVRDESAEELTTT